MPRPVDAQHARKRAAIVEAASGVFASAGFDRASTAAICRAAGISSGTFFHYFPTKRSALVAVLEAEADELRAALEAIEGAVSGLEAIERYADALADEFADSSYPTFVHGLAGVETDAEVAASLAAQERLVAGFLRRQVESGRHDGSVRRDVEATALAAWIAWMLDGAAQAALGDRTGTDVRAAVRALAAAR